MRTRPAAALSVAGVLAAGLVAALVNAQALASSGERSNALLASTEIATANSRVDATTSTLPAAGMTIFPVGDAGQITLVTNNDRLQLVAATPTDGWSITAITTTGIRTVIVDFSSAASELRITATLADGVITATITATATSPTVLVPVDPLTTTTTIAAPPTPTTGVTLPPKNDDHTVDGHTVDDHKDDDHKNNDD